MRSPRSLIAATCSASASQKRTDRPRRTRCAPTVPPIAPAPTTMYSNSRMAWRGAGVVYRTHPKAQGVTVNARTLLLLVVLAAAGAALAATTGGAAGPKHGGSITIARIEDSQSFDKTNVFQNESIWLCEQIMEPLYTVTPDGKSVKPWLGTGPFMRDKRVVGQSVTFKRNPNYWQKGKPYLDSVTWACVTNENTRELQLRGGQIQVDEFPPFNSISKLQHTQGVRMSLFPSTRTDYLDMNEQYAPLADRHVRRAISYAIDRKAIIKSVLFGHGTPANSFLPPQVPFYDSKSPGLQYDMAKAKAELAKSKYPKGFKVSLLVGAGAQVESAMGQILQSSLK